jgi:inhibitor of cysteine peptidase
MRFSPGSWNCSESERSVHLIYLIPPVAGIALAAAIGWLIERENVTVTLPPEPPPPVTVTETDRSVTLPQGTRLIVRLPIQPGTGFHWRVVTVDPARLHQDSPSRFEPRGNDPLPGGVEDHVFEFQTLAPGETTLGLCYERTVDPPEPAKRSFLLLVKIQNTRP